MNTHFSLRSKTNLSLSSFSFTSFKGPNISSFICIFVTPFSVTFHDMEIAK